MACYLVSYRPLAITARGRKAAIRDGLPPFVDGSCRREPDFEVEMPAVTSLCRGKFFVPRLVVDDLLVYLTVKSSFGNLNTLPHYRLVSCLRVVDISSSHEKAALWYRNKGLLVPNNCMFHESLPTPYSQTNGRNDGWLKGQPEHLKLRRWDGEYKGRATAVPVVAHCSTLFLDLENPPKVYTSDLVQVFKRVPGTQTPAALACEDVFSLLQKVLGELLASKF
jgi:hypothetical protein